LVADVLDGGPHRDVRALLRGAWSALARLLLVVVVGTITITVVSSIGPLLILAILATAVVNGAGHLLVLVLVLPLISILPFVLQVRLCTSWSVSAAVVVLERPGGLRALRRSNELVRGNRWRVLALILALAIPLAIAAGVVDAASGSASSVPGLADPGTRNHRVVLRATRRSAKPRAAWTMTKVRDAHSHSLPRELSFAPCGRIRQPACRSKG
jgi:hypothetical protein